ncbi:hypothetical protein PENTCL1PPCAC_7608, partial [Pristionchus entomophagus]
MRRKKQAEERQAHIADTVIHRFFLYCKASGAAAATAAAAGSFTGSAAAAPTDHHRRSEGI